MRCAGWALALRWRGSSCLAPAVVLTQVEKKAPFVFNTYYDKSEKAVAKTAENAVNRFTVIKTARYVFTVQGEAWPVVTDPSGTGSERATTG